MDIQVILRVGINTVIIRRTAQPCPDFISEFRLAKNKTVISIYPFANSKVVVSGREGIELTGWCKKQSIVFQTQLAEAS